MSNFGAYLSQDFQIHLARNFVFTAKDGGESFVKGNYRIIYGNNTYYFTLNKDYSNISKITIYQTEGSMDSIEIQFTLSDSSLIIIASRTPLANPIDITSKFEGIGSYVGDYTLYENAGFVIAYMNIDGTIQCVALLNDDNIPYDNYTRAYIKLKNGNILSYSGYAVENTNKHELCYPRLFLAKDNILYDADTLTITQAKQLEKFEDYSILVRNGKPYITLKSFRPNLFAANTTYTVNYQVSRANEMLYLDAL